MRYVISYDISNDKRRKKVATILEGHGYRVQYSVFECDLNERQVKALLRQLKPFVKSVEMDSVRVYPLPADVKENVKVLGNDMARTLGVIAIV